MHPVFSFLWCRSSRKGSDPAPKKMSDKQNLAKQYFVDEAIQEAEFILERIGKKWPVEGVSSQRG